MSASDHKKGGPQHVKAAVITVSDTRTQENDKSGALIQKLLLEHHHEVVQYEIVKDDSLSIRRLVTEIIRKKIADCILLNGGTGISKRDVTIETVKPLFEKELAGFGELFRMLSYTEDIGSAAILSRAAAGVSGGVAIFSMPGSTGAVKLAMEKLILPEIRHIVNEIRKQGLF